MAAADVRRTRAKLKAQGLEKAEVWVPTKAKAALKLIEDALRGKVGDEALCARVLARLELTADLVKAAPPDPAAGLFPRRHQAGHFGHGGGGPGQGQPMSGAPAQSWLAAEEMADTANILVQKARRALSRAGEAGELWCKAELRVRWVAGRGPKGGKWEVTADSLMAALGRQGSIAELGNGAEGANTPQQGSITLPNPCSAMARWWLS